MWKQIAHGNPALAVPIKIPQAAEGEAHVVELKCLLIDLHRKRFAVVPRESWLGIEGIDLAGPPIHVEKDHIFGESGKLRIAGLERVAPCRLGCHLGAGRFLCKERAERDRAKSIGSLREHAAAGERGLGNTTTGKPGKTPHRAAS